MKKTKKYLTETDSYSSEDARFMNSAMQSVPSSANTSCALTLCVPSANGKRRKTRWNTDRNPADTYTDKRF